MLRLSSQDDRSLIAMGMVTTRAPSSVVDSTTSPRTSSTTSLNLLQTFCHCMDAGNSSSARRPRGASFRISDIGVYAALDATCLVHRQPTLLDTCILSRLLKHLTAWLVLHNRPLRYCRSRLSSPREYHRGAFAWAAHSFCPRNCGYHCTLEDRTENQIGRRLHGPFQRPYSPDRGHLREDIEMSPQSSLYEGFSSDERVA
ncbi:hypothetical protein BKA70DRAFT_1282509 [Coprinopsis sp. MPI-PUGE-AT-0042]|nr:hypothetical protein BKA70DRAFT_1282509 [Coprinopsis sp. MPI-PUGE-AT-0042]